MVIRIPVAPGGWPIEMPPPYRLVRLRGIFSSASACRFTTANASLTHLLSGEF